jgi:TolB-like protein/DNA-binding SARP family transcriptional activator
VSEDRPKAPGASFHLRTFGTVALVRSDGTSVLGTHGQHRRRLALLAALAAAEEHGRARDQLLLLFWPEATQLRAQHSLDQLLYALRNSISESMFEGTNPLRLNPAVVATDVGRFTAALESGDLVGAVAEYRGPFLDGFYPSDAPEFERWATDERARLAESYAGALRTLARGATAAGDRDDAVRWWTALSETDPLSSNNAIGRIRALAAAGDRAAALQYAKRYEATVAQELGVGMDSGVAVVIAEVREASVGQPAADRASVADVADTAREASALSYPAVDARTVARRRRPTARVGTAVFAIALVATAALAVTIWPRAAARGAARTNGVEPSVAVLPLDNVSRSPDDAGLVDGLTEELSGVLARLGRLRVIASTSTFALKNSDVDVRRIADSLHVAYVLVGGVQRAGNQLHVQIRLVDGRDGSTRWSQTYDRELSDIVAVERDIAGAVARELDVRIGGAALAAAVRVPTRNIAAHDLYLRANDPTRLRSDSGARAALSDFRQAAALDTTYAAAYAGVARLQLRTMMRDFASAETRRGQLIQAERAALRAVRLDDSLADAHAALSAVRRSNYDLAAAMNEMVRAEALEPGAARFHESLVLLDVIAGRPTEALAEGRRAVALDPLSPSANAELAHALLAGGRCDDALAQLRTVANLQIPLLRAAGFAAQCYAKKQMWPQAIAESRSTLREQPHGNGLLGYLLARGGRVNEARLLLDTLGTLARAGGADAYAIAAVYAGLGNKDSAFTWLDRSIDDHSLGQEGFEYMNTVLDALGPDARVAAFRRRIGIQNR